MSSPAPDLAAFADELAAELAGQGPHDDLLVAEAVAAAVRLRVLHADPRLYLPHTVDRSWDRDHDLASRAYFRAHRALLASRSSSPNRSPARRPASPGRHPWIRSTTTPGPNPSPCLPEFDPRSPASPEPAQPPAAASPPESGTSVPASTPPIPAPPAAASTTPPSEPFETFLRPAPRHPRRPIRTHPRDPIRSRPHPATADRISFRRRPDDSLPLSANPRASPPA